jgi:tRNA A37 methylthiotransferase MiaB
VLNKNVFKKVTRNDLIAGYLGQTAIKTRKVIEECLGGVLFIDEAYSLANSDREDSYSKECLDILCESLSDHKNNLMVIIAGYEDELNETFFRVNKGLESRFIWRFTMDEYSAKELANIFRKMVLEQEWEMQDASLPTDKWTEERKKNFKHFGRDMELLLTYTKISHGRRIYGKSEEDRKKISLEDLNLGYEVFLKNKNIKKDSPFLHGIYV